MSEMAVRLLRQLIEAYDANALEMNSPDIDVSDERALKETPHD